MFDIWNGIKIVFKRDPNMYFKTFIQKVSLT